MTPTQKEQFILELRASGLEAKSANTAGATMAQLRREYEDDPAFQEEAEDAIALRADDYEAEAVRRAVDGVDKPVFYKGEEVGTSKEYSDSLLSKILTARIPKAYGDKKQITGPDNGPLQVIIRDFEFL